MTTRILMGITVAGILLALCHPARGQDSQQKAIFATTLTASVPNQTVGGVLSDARAWTLTRGKATITSDFRLEVTLKGLTTNAGGPPLTEVNASLVCGGSGGAVAFTTPGFALSPTGNGKTSVPIVMLGGRGCVGLTILVRTVLLDGSLQPTGQFVAISGFTSLLVADQGPSDSFDH